MSTFSGFNFDDPVNEAGVLEEVSLSEETQNSLFEQLLIEECSHFTEAQMNEFLESELCEALIQEGKMRKNTIVMLSKRDDQSRRNKIIAMNMAREKKDPLWEQLKKNRMKERALLGKIMQKYGRAAQKNAKKQQKDWIKNRMPANFGKFGGANRVSADAASKPSKFQQKYGL